MMVTALKIERMRKGVRQWRLASLVGISQAELSHYEIGRKQCPVDLRDKIAKVLECPTETLFPADEEKANS
jgi:transcriptional regulator with XRE-family HTH domain